MTTTELAIKKRSSRKFRILRGVAVVNVFLLIVNLISYFFVIGPSVFQSHAADQIVCMNICAAGDTACLTDTECTFVPSVTTNTVSNITNTTADVQGTITADGYSAITQRGIAVATSTDPTITDLVFTTSGTTGTFTSTATGLTKSTGYYVRAFGTNARGTSYGQNIQFTTTNSGGNQGGQPGNNSGNSGGGNQIPPVQNNTTTATSTDTGADIDKGKPFNIKDYLNPDIPPYDRAQVDLQQLFNYENRSGKDPNADNRNPKIKTRRPSFKGRTNIKNAIILIEVHSDVIKGTTFADKNGYFEWTATSDLSGGEHTVIIQSISPDNGSVTDTRSYNFVITLDETPATPPVSPPPPPSPPPSGDAGTGQTTGESTQEPTGDLGEPAAGIVKDFVYGINLEVEKPDEGKIERTNELHVITDIVSFNPEITEDLILVYTIHDTSGGSIYSEEKQVTVKDRYTDRTTLILQNVLLPDFYVVSVELKYHGQIFVSSEVIKVEPYTIISTPVFTITNDQAEYMLRVVATALFVSLLFLVFLLYREYQKALKAKHHVSEEDLLNSGMIS